jgi:hypothetical protein
MMSNSNNYSTFLNELLLNRKSPNTKHKKPASFETGFVKNRILMIMLRMEV